MLFWITKCSYSFTTILLRLDRFLASRLLLKLLSSWVMASSNRKTLELRGENMLEVWLMCLGLRL